MTRPAPLRTAESAEFWAAAGDGRLVTQRCATCGTRHHPPVAMCPACLSSDLAMADVSGTGTVHSFALLHHPRHPAFPPPVVAALVQLDEGPRLLSNLTQVDPADVRIGMPVAVVFAPTRDGGAVPLFAPVRR